MHAGHFYSVGDHPAVRFNPDNAHGQCHRCNTFLHGNLLNYRENLLQKIGNERLENLKQKAHHRAYRYDRLLLIDLIEKFKNTTKCN